VGRPELLFLDEPTAGFDPSARRDFHDLIAGLADVDTTILMTTHDLDEAEKVADRILILAAGAVVADGTPDALRLGMSSSNEVRVRDRATGEVTIHATPDPTSWLASLLATRADEVEVLEVRPASLEEAYLSLVREAEQRGEPSRPEPLEVTR
ncbi:MAG: ABC transporter ATP-binding protein, partial [Propionibacterium sp.]|nr:ABC transporter ATP-binding protein [Propionibacterium sp.]